jgi:nitroimidazol reductase NimA-like FMN-containing flavoprotein (pyridoxamine 5'-phosphate oxidase superfamily)
MTIPISCRFIFAYADNHLYALSMPGKKIEWMRANPQVSVLVEEHEKTQGWKSVIIDGRYEELPDRNGHQQQRDHAWSPLSRHVDWWEPGALKPKVPSPSDHSEHVFFGIFVDQLSGRAATREAA